jgi:hypothetical protein
VVERDPARNRWRALAAIAALVLAATPAALADVIPPAAVDDLTIITLSNDRLGLRWSATGDDGYEGIASVYDIRYAPGVIANDALFDMAWLAVGEPAPEAAGTVQYFAIEGLAADQFYSVRMKVIDEVGNPSSLSNLASATTTLVDGEPPGFVTLSGVPSGFGEVSLSWIATGDDGPFGVAAGGYDLRRSLTPITTLAEFDAAVAVGGVPPPAPAGTPMGMTVGGLAPGTDWYFAMRAFDDSGNGSQLPSIPMMMATLPEYLEFGDLTLANRIEAVAIDYSAVTDLGGGAFELSGDAIVVMGGFARSFGFVDLETASGETAGNGDRALLVTAGTATVDTVGAPILYPAADDLELELSLFDLSAAGGIVAPLGMKLTLPADLTSAIGGELVFFDPFPIEQDLDFTAAVTVGPGFFFAPKDYPFRISPQAGVDYLVDRKRVELGLSDLVYLDKEQGDLIGGLSRCQVSGACADDGNDGIFKLGWGLNEYAAGGAPPSSIGTPFVDSLGLRATLYLDVAGATYSLLFPAGAQMALDEGSTIEFDATEPNGGGLSGTLSLTLHTGAVLTESAGPGDAVLINDDCSGEQTVGLTFTGGQVLSGGEIRIASLSPAGGWTELSWGDTGPATPVEPDPPHRGFFVGGLIAGDLSLYAPGTVARIDADRPTVQRHFLAERDDGPADERGIYAGLNVTGSGSQMTGFDTSCPPADVSGHSFSTDSTETQLYLRRSGASGIADAGSFASPLPFRYMGYDMEYPVTVRCELLLQHADGNQRMRRVR